MKFEEQGEKKWKRKQTSKETAVPYDRKLVGHTGTFCTVPSVNIITAEKRTNLTFFSAVSRSEGTVPSLCGKPELFWVGYVQVRLTLAIPAPHLGLLRKTGGLCGAAGVGLPHEGTEEWGATGTPGLAVTPDGCHPMGTESP